MKLKYMKIESADGGVESVLELLEDTMRNQVMKKDVSKEFLR